MFRVQCPIKIYLSTPNECILLPARESTREYGTKIENGKEREKGWKGAKESIRITTANQWPFEW